MNRIKWEGSQKETDLKQDTKILQAKKKDATLFGGPTSRNGITRVRAERDEREKTSGPLMKR